MSIVTMLKKFVIPFLLAALLLGLAFSLSGKQAAPAVTFTTLEGKTIDMQQLKGKMVLVNFWATTCPGCIAEMPQLIQAYRKHQPKGFEVVAVAMSYDPAEQVRTFTTKRQLPFPVTLDADGTLAKAFGDVKLTPTAVLIDQQGNIIATTVGELDFAKLDQQLESQLGRAGA